MTEAVVHNDAWVNLATGVGGAKDKSSGFAFSPSFIAEDWATLERLYEQEHICATIVDALPDLVFSRGWQLELADQVQREALIDCLDELEAEAAVHQAMCYERLHGGAAIFVGTDDIPLENGKRARFDEPLREDAVRNVLYLHVLDRWELTPARFYTDPTHRKFGRPSHYWVHPTDVSIGQHVMAAVVHESRLILFPGEQTTKRKRIENQYWGQSVLVRAYVAVKQYGGSMASTLALMADASQGIYKIKGLLDIIRSGNTTALETRMRAMERVRSSLNAILLDTEGEGYERIATTLTELGNLIDRFQLQVASAARMPATEIFGRSAAGLNATGENDMRTWYDKGSKTQQRRAKPALERVLRLLMRSKQGPTQGAEPAAWSVKFPSLWQPSGVEAATIKKTKAETAAIYQDMGVVTAEQIARAHLSGSEWDSELTLKPEEIEALKMLQMLSGSGLSIAPTADPGADIDPEMGEVQVTQDDEGEELAFTNPRELAAKMTELGIGRCEHGKANRCPLCGIERQRDVEIGPSGEAAWALKWRAIGERAASAVVNDADQPRAEDGRFGEVAGEHEGSKEISAKQKASADKKAKAKEERTRAKEARKKLLSEVDTEIDAHGMEAKQAHRDTRAQSKAITGHADTLHNAMYESDHDPPSRDADDLSSSVSEPEQYHSKVSVDVETATRDSLAVLDKVMRDEGKSLSEAQRAAAAEVFRSNFALSNRQAQAVLALRRKADPLRNADGYVA